jgi:hypothetical protein
MINNIINCIRVTICIVFLLLPVANAQTETTASISSNVTTETSSVDIERDQTIQKLYVIKIAIDSQRELVQDLLVQFDTADEATKNSIREQLSQLRQSIKDLTRSFEYFAVNGISLSGLDEGESTELDWREELIQIARPILNSLKEATEKPRKIEELRRSIEQYEKQLILAQQGKDAIELLYSAKPEPVVANSLDEIEKAWQERSMNIQRSLEIAQTKLQLLEGENTQFFETTGRALLEFLQGRGLSLLLAIVIALAIWLAMRSLRRLVTQWRKPKQDSEHKARVRLLLYVYHFLTMALMSLSVLTVFYLRGDLLLLSLGIFALAMLMLSVWRFLPSYIAEARLLLNLGAVRESERVIYEGLPFRITSLNLYSELRNPELEGSIRLPLSSLSGMISRPRLDETWFPTQTDDYILMPDGSYAQVLQQTIEMVRLKIAGKSVQYASTDFLNLSVQNLSRDGFGIIVVFGIDYQHQAIALDQVPARFKLGLQAAFNHSDYADDLKDLVVDFKSAASNSLDYLVYATLDGRVADSYFSIGRLIQKTCVEICNQEAWVIPFSQLTIHQAESPPSE